MFDLGMQELIVIFVVALLVFGPQKLPEIARSLGKGMAELRKSLQGVKEQIDSEMEEIEKPIKEELKDITKDIPSARDLYDIDKIDKKDKPIEADEKKDISGHSEGVKE